jgi:outer membrane protein OmpA-like peptidoglycan-associated protein/tetratricopeptide (TPR) repeat protein
MNHKSTLLLSFLLLTGLAPFSSKAQDFKKKYEDASILFNNNAYDQALPIFLVLDSIQPDNNNTQFQTGVCYLNAPIHQEKAIPYLQKACTDVSDKYNPSSYKEKHAPSDALLYLARAYHITYQFDTAITYYNKFLSMIDTTDKQTIKDTKREIQMCLTGKDLVANPVKLVVTNLGDSINSAYPDYSPVVTADESEIIFTSRRAGQKDGTGQYFENIYMAYNKNGQWGQAFNIGPPINNAGQHEATVGISPDGQTIFIYKDDNGDGNIYTTHLNGTMWSTPEKLNDNIDSKYWEPSASISADGQSLYFTSNRPGGFGGRDIYVSHLLPNGQWSKAQNLGPKINTEYEEDAPFIHPDGKTLYFSSTGHNTMGGFDIFSSTLDSNGHWSDPVNIGYPVNTPGDDIFFFPTADGKGAYYSSFKDGGQGEKDIYRITFPAKKAEALTVYRGVIKSAVDSSVPQNIEIVVTDVTTGEQVGVYHPNTATGRYLFILPSGKNYNITYNADGYLFTSENLDVRDSTAYQIIDHAIDLNPFKIGEKIVLRNIFFPSGKAQLAPESQAELNHLYDLMTKFKGLKVEISGHTDAQGSDAINMPLSLHRAESVIKYLEEKGIDSARFQAAGYGPTQPMARNKNADGSWNREGMRMNRRIEFKILSTSVPINVEQPV